MTEPSELEKAERQLEACRNTLHNEKLLREAAAEAFEDARLAVCYAEGALDVAEQRVAELRSGAPIKTTDPLDATSGASNHPHHQPRVKTMLNALQIKLLFLAQDAKLQAAIRKLLKYPVDYALTADDYFTAASIADIMSLGLETLVPPKPVVVDALDKFLGLLGGPKGVLTGAPPEARTPPAVAMLLALMLIHLGQTTGAAPEEEAVVAMSALVSSVGRYVDVDSETWKFLNQVFAA